MAGAVWDEPREEDRCPTMKGLVEQGKEFRFYPESIKKLLKGFNQICDVTWFTF